MPQFWIISISSWRLPCFIFRWCLSARSCIKPVETRKVPIKRRCPDPKWVNQDYTATPENEQNVWCSYSLLHQVGFCSLYNVYFRSHTYAKHLHMHREVMREGLICQSILRASGRDLQQSPFRTEYCKSVGLKNALRWRFPVRALILSTTFVNHCYFFLNCSRQSGSVIQNRLSKLYMNASGPTVSTFT